MTAFMSAPLSPIWMLDSDGKGVRLVPQTADPRNRRCMFEIVQRADHLSKGTVKGGSGECPFSDCGRIIDGDEIKSQAQAGKMGQQLYTVIYKYQKVVGKTKSGKDRVKTLRSCQSSSGRESGFRHFGMVLPGPCLKASLKHYRK
jgi:putative DNA methylase